MLFVLIDQKQEISGGVRVVVQKKVVVTKSKLVEVIEISFDIEEVKQKQEEELENQNNNKGSKKLDVFIKKSKKKKGFIISVLFIVRSKVNFMFLNLDI